MYGRHSGSPQNIPLFRNVYSVPREQWARNSYIFMTKPANFVAQVPDQMADKELTGNRRLAAANSRKE
jgi:hypothetical protein